VNYDPSVSDAQRWQAVLNEVKSAPFAVAGATAAATSAIVNHKDSLSAFAVVPPPKYGNFGSEADAALFRG
jgi:hypothetical protein